MNSPDTNSRRGSLMVWVTLLVALVTVAGSLALTLVEGLKPCPLCFYQRTFAMGVLGLIIMGLLAQGRPAVLSAAALPLVVGGFGVSVFHIYLEFSKTLDCPTGLMGIGTAPQQSFAAYLLLLIVVLGGCLAGRIKQGVIVTAVVVGAAFAGLSCISNGKLPSTPNPKFDDDGNRVIIGCEPHWEESMGRD